MGQYLILLSSNTAEPNDRHQKDDPIAAKVTAVLSITPRTPEEISERSKVDLNRVTQHLKYWTARGHFHEHGGMYAKSQHTHGMTHPVVVSAADDAAAHALADTIAKEAGCTTIRVSRL